MPHGWLEMIILNFILLFIIFIISLADMQALHAELRQKIGLSKKKTEKLYWFAVINDNKQINDY